MTNARGHKGFAPIIEKLGDAVRQATANAPRRKRAVTRGISEDNFRASEAERFDFYEQVDALIGGRYAIKRCPEDKRHYEIWDAESSGVYGPYRTYADAAKAAEELP